ncbi:ankyrin repeat domain-containing protein 16-like isoform X2 [Pogonomyrmex barbatus]|uniref:Ankyrin repeat domain-containing protein 16-like isoform X2 n=1 Tax=Pogonomyrmex barbatus TaxID=144034 RepID=A0A6I9WSX3_9HYME|nr:ankyrin repeat domain-containing protein 16-like isoform X2 [Pogonomyrmex barbatus]
MVDEDINNSLRRFHYRKILREILRACQNGDLDRIKTILEKEGHRIRGWGSFGHEVSGDTVLHVAAQAGNMSIVKYLSKHTDEFKVNVKNKDMKTPLHCAAQFAREDVLKYLLEKGAEVDALKRADWTPLMLACTKSGPTAHECIKALLAAKANASFRNKDGWPSLFIACRTGDEESVNILLKHWPEGIHEWTNNGRTVLHIAALHGHERVIDLLVRANADVNAQDSSGSTPLREAAKHGNLDMRETNIATVISPQIEILTPFIEPSSILRDTGMSTLGLSTIPAYRWQFGTRADHLYLESFAPPNTLRYANSKVVDEKMTNWTTPIQRVTMIRV